MQQTDVKILLIAYVTKIYGQIKVAMRQFNEIQNFANSFIFCTIVFCTGVLQYAFCFVYR